MVFGYLHTKRQSSHIELLSSIWTHRQVMHISRYSSSPQSWLH